MSAAKRSRHQTNGKKNVHDTRTLSHGSNVNIFNSFVLVLFTGLRPEVVQAAEVLANFAPP